MCARPHWAYRCIRATMSATIRRPGRMTYASLEARHADT